MIEACAAAFMSMHGSIPARMPSLYIEPKTSHACTFSLYININVLAINQSYTCVYIHIHTRRLALECTDHEQMLASDVSCGYFLLIILKIFNQIRKKLSSILYLELFCFIWVDISSERYFIISISYFHEKPSNLYF